MYNSLAVIIQGYALRRGNSYFEKKGPNNTEKTLEISKDEALRRGIKYLVVASTRGATGLQAAQMLQNTGIQLVVVGHSTGHMEVGQVRYYQVYSSVAWY